LKALAASIDEAVDCSGFDTLDECVTARGTSWLCTVSDCTTQNGAAASSAVQEGLLIGAGFDIPSVYDTTAINLLQSGEDAVNSLYPSDEYMIYLPLVLVFVTAFTIALATIPSSIPSTALKLRCGVIKYLHEPRIYGLRKAPDQVAILQGTMFWSGIFSAGLMGFIFGLVLFLI
jgi:hypothetical protein